MSPLLLVSPRILLIRLSAIGDVVMASGLVPALRERFPGATIAWLTYADNADLLRHNPRLDRLFLLPHRRWQELRQRGEYGQWLREWAELVHALRAERFDLAVDLHGLLKSGAWCRLSGARRRLGLGSREGSHWLMTEVLERRSEDLRIGSEYRKLASHLGVQGDAYTLDVPVAAEDRAAAAELLSGAGVTGGYVVFCPFTTRPQKHWFDERWAGLAERLTAATGCAPLLLGAGGDAPRAAGIRAAAGVPVVDLTGRTTLGQCAALLAGARLAVGVDTGLTHLAIARATPTLALFGSTQPYLDPDTARCRVLYEALSCSPCRRRPTCDGRFDCMRLLTVDKVAAAALELLQSLAVLKPAAPPCP